MAADQACPVCDKLIDGGGAVRLWDGRTYCRACVEAECPGLADYAATHDHLAESAPFDLRVCLWLASWVSAAALLVFGLLGVIVGGSEWGAKGALVTGLLTGGCAAIFGFVWAFGRMMVDRAILLGAVAADGRIEAQSGRSVETLLARWRRGRHLKWPLEQCRWYVTRRARHLVWPRPERVIMLVLPLGRVFGVSLFRREVACGLTPETFALWRGFLTLARVPRIEPDWTYRLHPFFPSSQRGEGQDED